MNFTSCGASTVLIFTTPLGNDMHEIRLYYLFHILYKCVLDCKPEPHHTLLSQLCSHLWQSTVNYISQSLLQVAESKVKCSSKNIYFSVCLFLCMYVCVCVFLRECAHGRWTYLRKFADTDSPNSVVFYSNPFVFVCEFKCCKITQQTQNTKSLPPEEFLVFCNPRPA